MPNVVCGSRATVSCPELSSLNTPAFQDCIQFIPSTTTTQQQQHQKNNYHHRLSISEFLDLKSKKLSRYHLASLAQAARQISSRDSDSPLPRKARWLIIFIGVTLFGMSMLLVGITLRLAPMIDEIVRKEHEELLRKMSQSVLGFNSVNSTNTGEVGGNSTVNSSDDIVSGLPDETEVDQVDGQADSTPPRPPWPSNG